MFFCEMTSVSKMTPFEINLPGFKFDLQYYGPNVSTTQLQGGGGGGFVYLGRTQIHFLSDVSSAIASSDRKVPITVTRHILVYIAHTLLV